MKARPKAHLHKHPDGADDEGEEGARPVELVDDLGAVDIVEGGSVVEVKRLVDALEVGDEDEAGGGEGAQQQGAPVQQAQGPANGISINDVPKGNMAEDSIRLNDCSQSDLACFEEPPTRIPGFCAKKKD